MARIREVLAVFRGGRPLSVAAVAAEIEEEFNETSRVVRLLWARGHLDAAGLRGLEWRRHLKPGEKIRELEFTITDYGRRKLTWWESNDGA